MSVGRKGRMVENRFVKTEKIHSILFFLQIGNEKIG